MIKMKFNYKKAFVISVITLLFLPSLYFFGMKCNVVTYGSEEIVELPSLQTSSFKKKVFQKNFEKYWETHFWPRNFMLKTKNTLYDYANLRLIHSGFFENIVEGKNKYLFGKYLFESVHKNCTPFPSLEPLKEFYNKAKKKGIDVYFVLAPSKALTYYDYLPDRYKFFLGKDCGFYEQFMDAFAEMGMPAYNTKPLMKELREKGDIEPFPIGGIHWNFYGAGMAVKESFKHFSLGDIEIKGIEKSNFPYFAEQDLTYLQNTYLRKKNDRVFYKPVLAGDFKLKGKTSIIGDSYSNEYNVSLKDAKITEDEELKHYVNVPLTEDDVKDIMKSKRIIFVYTDAIVDPNHQFYKKLDMLLNNFRSH